MRTLTHLKKKGYTLIELMIVVAIVSILAVLAVYGVRRYVANAKTAEARNSLGQIAKDAQTAYEKDTTAAIILGPGAITAVTRSLCQSAGSTVPNAPGLIQGKKYQSNGAVGQDWLFDEATNKGFACLKFGMTNPQFYMYNYWSDATAAAPGANFTATANGDLNGNGILSVFTLVGQVLNNQLNVAPNITEVDPEE
jgi:type IV pilus assembly protein PilA